VKSLRIGKVELRPHEPVVIVPVTDRTPPRAIVLSSMAGVELVEARVDLFEEHDAEKVSRFIRAVRRALPVLVTVRAAAEGGAWREGEPARLALYRALLPEVDALDVELAAPIRRAVVQAARKAKKLVVLSHHDFRRTPPDAALDRVVTQGFKAGADIVKIAAHVADDRDTARLAALFARHPKKALVVIGMGDHGKKTRVLFPALGSRFTFAALDKGTAPGQLDVEAMRRTLSLLFPDFARRATASSARSERSRPRALRKPARVRNPRVAARGSER
jgi:3-dehydroquinate dehydratase-1